MVELGKEGIGTGESVKKKKQQRHEWNSDLVNRTTHDPVRAAARAKRRPYFSLRRNLKSGRDGGKTALWVRKSERREPLGHFLKGPTG